MFRTFFILLYFLPIVFFAQENNKYSFTSSPSFHNGFEIEFFEDSNVLKFHTNNIYYVLDSLKFNYKSYPKFYFEDKDVLSNRLLLSNSTFEKNISTETKTQLKEMFNNFAQVCKKNEGKSDAYDGIYFKILAPNYSQCSIQFSKEEEQKVIEKILKKIGEVFNPNSFVDKYIFHTKEYLDNYIAFDIKSINPLFIKLYNISNFGCYFFKPLIDKLPSTNQIYIDITELSSYTSEDDKECLIETINKKYMKVKVIQSKEKDFFNEL